MRAVSAGLLAAGFVAAGCLGGLGNRVEAQEVSQLALGRRSAPTGSYFAVFPAYYEGEYRDALKGFKSEGRTAIKNGPGNHWIDSICYHTMSGECYYQMGQLGPALEHYTSALELFAAYSDWMLRVKFEPAIRPANPGRVRQVPWGQSERQARVGNFPETTLIEQGRINNNDQVRRGGVVQPPVLYPLNVQEIVRCTALAMRRRHELLGPAAPYDRLTNEVLSLLSRRPSQPNHWSEAWIDAQLGLAYAAAGKDAQAKNVLQRAVVAAGEFDHPLTATVLLELGRLAFVEGDYASAESYFLEASYAAVNFYDVGVLEESLRYGLLTHLVGNRQGLYAPLATAPAWANVQDLRHLQASLLILLAENHCALGQPKPAAAALADARSVMGRRDMGAGKLGARLNYIAALSLFQQGKPEGETPLAAALAFQREASLWLFHRRLVDNLWVEQGVSDRVAMDLYAGVLRDPTPADWATDPLESLGSLLSAQSQMFEHWFEVALSRNEHERALEIADLARRHRFLNTLPMGGRLLGLRWVLEGPAETLDQQATLQRQDLLVHYPAYDQRRQQVDRLRGELAQMPLVPGNPAAAKQQAARLEQLARLSQAQETLLHEIALRREPCELVFPPVRSTKQAQQSLAEGQALLVFFSTSRATYAFLMDRERYGHWPVAAPKTFVRQVTGLLREWGNYDQNREITLAEMADGRWREMSRDVLDVLMKDSGANLAEMFQELVIVPDGLLWYVPFEALGVADGDEIVPLISQVRIRYAPTMGLAVSDPRPRRQSGHTAVVLGRLFPRDEDAVAEAAFDSLGRVVPGAVALKGGLPSPSATYASLFDRLIVYSDITPSANGPYEWAPLQIDRGQPGSTLSQWFALPFGGPEQVLLPGFHTAAERALKGQSGQVAGEEMFLSICGLMSTGTRTVLMSRWRTGGQTSYDLVREFAQELPHTTAADAWQRAVLLVSQMPLNPELEPRLKREEAAEPVEAAHPFFWAGYLLVDTGAAPRAEDPEDPAAAGLVKRPGDEDDAGEGEGEQPADPPAPEDQPEAAEEEQDPVGIDPAVADPADVERPE